MHASHHIYEDDPLTIADTVSLYDLGRSHEPRPTTVNSRIETRTLAQSLAVAGREAGGTRLGPSDPRTRLFRRLTGGPMTRRDPDHEARRLRDEMTRLGVTQAQIAYEASIPLGTVSSVLRRQGQYTQSPSRPHWIRQLWLALDRFGSPHPAIAVEVSGDLLDDDCEPWGFDDGFDDDQDDDDVLDAGLDLDALDEGGEVDRG